MNSTAKPIALPVFRLPPCDIQAEGCALASMAMAGIGDPLFDEMRSILSAESFYEEDHRIIFSALCRMKDQGKPIDFVTLRQHLDERQELKAVGGTEFLALMLHSMPSAAHGVHYARIVSELSQRRELIRIANLMLRDCYGDDGAVEASVIGNKASTSIASLLNAGNSIAYVTGRDAILDAFDQIESGGVELIPTGFRDLDEAIGGIGLGEMMIIGARPSMGKSTIARQIAMRVATKHPVAFISLEENASKIGRNWLSAASSIDNNRLRRAKNLLKEEWVSLTAGVAKMAELPVFLAARAFEMQAIKSVASMLVSKHGVKLVIVDYLQKIKIEGRDRFEKVTNASQELSALWKELNVAGLVLAQLKREVEHRDDKRPSMSDLRESGQIEQDADAILFLHREDYYGAADPKYVMTQQAELIIAKMRDGERGKAIILRSELNYQRFADVEQRPDLVGAFD